MKTFIIASVTADGFIGRDAGHLSLEWTSPEDKRHFVQKTKEAGVMVMGSKTFATIGRGLPGRKTYVYTSQPAKVAGIKDVEATNAAPAELLQQLANEGYRQAAICGGTSVYTMFMHAGVVDELYLTVEPVVFGAGLKLFDEELLAKLVLIENRQLNDNTVLLHYKVER